MYYFFYLLEDHPLVGIAYVGFVVWLLVDVHRRGVEQWWFYVILFFPLIGPLVYFFAEKWRHLDLRLPAGGLFERKTPVEELEFRSRQSPTLANHLALAERFMELSRFEDAIRPLEAARKLEPDHGPVCYRLARCHYELGRPAEAMPFLVELVNRDPRWEDYAAWRLLVEVQEALGHEAVVETARQLVKMSPRMEHKYLLAQQLVRHQLDGEARLVLENALQEQQFVTGPVARVNRKWVKEAKRLLRELTPS